MTATLVREERVVLKDGRTLANKLVDIISCVDKGASTSKTATQNTTAINSAATSAAAAGGFVLVPPGISYTEGSLVIPANVTIVVFDASANITFLSKNQSSALTGTVRFKMQGNTAVGLRSVDNGVSTEPILQLLNAITGGIAALELKFLEYDEITPPTAPAVNKARVFVQDTGGGLSQLAIRFPSGEVIPLVTQGQKGNLVGTVVWDAGSIAVGGSATTTITTTGAVLGDFVLPSCSISLAGLTLTAYVSATNTVTIVLANNTAGAVDLASATFSALVIRNW